MAVDEAGQHGPAGAVDGAGWSPVPVRLARAGMEVDPEYIERMRNSTKGLPSIKEIKAMDNPDEAKQARAARKAAAEKEGKQICVDVINACKEIEGVAGVHIMAIEWEHKVPEIAERAKVLPRPTV